MDSSNRIPTKTRIVTIQDIKEKEKSEVLILRLRADKKELEAQKSGLEEKVNQLSSSLAKSTSGRVLLQQSSHTYTNISPVSISEMETGEVQAIESDDENTYFDCEQGQDNLETLKNKEVVIDNKTAVVESQIQEEQQLTLLQRIGYQLSDKVGRHLIKVVRREGTTLASAATTAAVGVGFAVAGPAGAGILAIGAGLISGNELLKIVLRHFNDLGATDHLQAVGKALDSIEAKNFKAAQSIEHAMALQKQVHTSIGEIAAQIQTLEALLKNADAKLSATIQKAIYQLKNSQETLLQQHTCLEQAVGASKGCIFILDAQRKQINDLLGADYKIESQEDLEAVLKEINASLNAIQSSSQESYVLQLKATNAILEALEMNGKLLKSNDISCKLIGEIQTVQQELQAAQQDLSEMAEKASEAKKATEKLEKELQLQRQLNKEQQADIAVAKDQLEKEKAEEKFGEESIRIGSVGAAVGGGMAALALGGAGYCRRLARVSRIKRLFSERRSLC